MSAEDQAGPLSKEEIDTIVQRHFKKAGTFGEGEVKPEGKQVYGTLTLPGGGVFHGGVQHDRVVIQAMSGRSDMLMMDSDKDDALAMKDMVTSSVKKFGEHEDAPTISQCVREGMLLADYTYLLFRLRQLSVGDKVVFSSRCENCGNEHEYNIFISSLDFEFPEEFDPSIESTRHKTFEFDYYGANWQINWSLMTEGDSFFLKRFVESEIERKRKEKTGSARTKNDANSTKPSADIRFIMSGGQSGIDYISANLLARVRSVVEPGYTTESGEEVPPKTIVLGRSHKSSQDELSVYASLDYIRSLPHALRLAFWKEADRLEPSMDTNVVFSCVTCEHSNSQIIHPLEPNFFFPSEILVD